MDEAAPLLKSATGVYRISNTVNGKVYVGSATSSITARWTIHRCHLRAGKHHSSHLQAAWNKYGEAAFVFEVIEYAFPDNCLAREQHHIDAHQSAKRAFGYNISPTAGNNKGLKKRPLTEAERARISAFQKTRRRNPHSPETRAKIALSRRGKVASAETKAKMSAMRRGRRGKPHSAESKAKMSLSLKGKALSVEHRAKISAGVAGLWKGRTHRPESKAKMSAARKGKPGRTHTAETRAKIAAANKGKPKSAEHRAKLSEAASGRNLGKPLAASTRAKLSTIFKGRTFTPETLAKMRESARKRVMKKQSPETIAKRVAGVKLARARRKAAQAAGTP